uniref:Uncharacterized protein n=1 Tax=Arundo donax TaxID=35708 RepID=A0A0A9AJY3_ARUDO
MNKCKKEAINPLGHKLRQYFATPHNMVLKKSSKSRHLMDRST